MRVLLDGSALEGRGHRLTCQGWSRGHGLTLVMTLLCQSATPSGLGIRRGRLLAVGCLLAAGTGLCGLLVCRPVRCPACLAAPSATTPGALLLGGRLPEMSVGSTVLIASGR